jgi:aminoglycoside phosphotransferase (APT) family kinase protein
MTAVGREQVTVTLSQIGPILRDLGASAPIAIVAMTGGSSQVFRLDLADGSALVLKTYDDTVRSAAAKEAYMSSLLDGLDIPYTRIFARDETNSRLPFCYSIANFLPGVPAHSFKDDPDVADLYRQMGAMLRQVHTIRMPAYGFFDRAGVLKPAATNAAFLRSLAADAFSRFRHYGADHALADRLERIFYQHLDAMSVSGGPVFAHDDFHPNNVLAQRDASGRLQLTGLIDFGNALAADPVHDLAKALFCCEHEAPGSSAAIREGYGPIDHPDPEAALQFYTLLHRVIMWWWLRRVGVLPEGDNGELIVALRATADNRE